MKKPEKFSEDIIRILPDKTIEGYLLCIYSDGLVTIISEVDGSIPYPYLQGNEIKEFNSYFFYFRDENNLEFLVEKSTGRLVTLDNIEEIKFDYQFLSHEELEQIDDFYRKRWNSIHEDYYLYTNLSTNLKTLVRNWSLDIILRDVSDIYSYVFDNSNIAIIVKESGKQILYNINMNLYFDMAEASIIDPIFNSSFVLIGEKENELMLYHIKDDRQIEPVFDELDLYINKDDIFKLKNGKFLINVKNEVYLL